MLSSGAPNAHVGAQQRDLATFLLWFFMPQVILYAFGAVATALLYAKRRFAITAAAPIGNSIVIIACMFAFNAMQHGEPTFTMTTAEKFVLAAAGTGGVLAFVAILMVAARQSGFSLRPRWFRHDEALTRLVAAKTAWSTPQVAQEIGSAVDIEALTRD